MVLIAGLWISNLLPLPFLYTTMLIAKHKWNMMSQERISRVVV